MYGLGLGLVLTFFMDDLGTQVHIRLLWRPEFIYIHLYNYMVYLAANSLFNYLQLISRPLIFIYLCDTPPIGVLQQNNTHSHTHIYKVMDDLTSFKGSETDKLMGMFIVSAASV